MIIHVKKPLKYGVRARKRKWGEGKRGKREGSARFASIPFPKARNVGHPKISLRSEVLLVHTIKSNFVFDY